jgi:hypothetical protein
MENNNRIQAEAYHLMVYRCEKCGFREKIWNSRIRFREKPRYFYDL